MRGRSGVRARMVELMAGSRRMASAFARAGVPARSFEIEDDPAEDVMQPHIRKWLCLEVERQRIDTIWMGLPCSSWSRARRNTTGRPGWPRPLRAAGALWGLPVLTQSERDQVRRANEQVRLMVVLFTKCVHSGVTMVVENPRGSWLWHLPCVKKLMAQGSVTLIDFDMCAFRTAWKKPTRLLMCHARMEALGSCRCSASRGVCGFSGAPHVPLAGSDGRRFKTRAAQEYPVDLCQLIACTLRRAC